MTHIPTLGSDESMGEANLAKPLSLLPFQFEGVERLLAQNRIILADDMRTGKSVQAIVAAREMKIDQVLIICQNGKQVDWRDEITRWDPTAKWQIISGWQQQRSEMIKTAKKRGVKYTIINYEAVHSHACSGITKAESTKRHDPHDSALWRHWDLAILDEVHRCKNHQGVWARAVRRICRQSDGLFLLTGTPALNTNMDLYSLLNMIDGKKFSSYWDFAHSYFDVKHNGFGYDVWDIIDPNHPQYFKTEKLAELLDKYMLRRRRSDPGIAHQFPKKWVHRKHVQLEGRQRALYDQLEKDLVLNFTEPGKSPQDAREFAQMVADGEIRAVKAMLGAISLMKQIAIDETLIEPGYEEQPLKGPKVDRLAQLIEENSDEKVIVFSQYRKVIDRLSLIYPDALVLTGLTDKRGELVERFQTDPTARLLLTTVQTSGVGFTLSAANLVVFMDRLWVPKLNEQAEDRPMSWNPDEDITAYILEAENTIEQYIEEVNLRKNAAFDLVINAEALSS